MSRRGIWRTLGIDPTSETGAIRRAYAQALRAMDPDADPQGFARLREARDQALVSARRTVDQESAEPGIGTGPDDFDRTLPTSVATTLIAPTVDFAEARGTIGSEVEIAADAPFRLRAARADSGDGIAISTDHDAMSLAPAVLDDPVDGHIVAGQRSASDRFDAAYRDVVDLLYPAEIIENQWLSDDDDAVLIALVDMLLDDPRLEQIAFRADAERWFGEILAGAIPRSDPVLRRIAERFAWFDQMGHIAQTPNAERIAERARALDFVAAVQRPDHADHRLWKELTKPAREKSRRAFWLGKKSVRSFIARVRRDFPDAEAYFDPFRVALWENSAGGPGWGAWGLGIFVMLRLIGAMASNHGQTEPPSSPVPLVASASPPIVDRDGNINLALLSIADGFTVDRVKDENPELYAALSRRWSDANRIETPISDYLSQMRDFLDERFRAALPNTGYDQIAAWRQLDLADLERARTRGWDICARYLDGQVNAATSMPESDRLSRRRLIAEMILGDHHPDREPPAGPQRYTIPAGVVTAVRHDTHLDAKAVSTALQGDGTARNRCEVRHALIASALSLPGKQGLTLLRTM